MARFTRAVFVALLGVLCAAGCATKVRVPPRVDLGAWPTVGLIEFTGDPRLGLGDVAARRFVQMLQDAQPQARIVELGALPQVLARLDRSELDFETVRTLGEQYGVGAVFVGDLELSRPKPQVRFGRAFTGIEARADVNARLAARLLETRSGATLWSRASDATGNVAHLGVGVIPSFGASDPADVHAELVGQLVTALRADFEPRWVKQ